MPLSEQIANSLAEVFQGNTVIVLFIRRPKSVTVSVELDQTSLIGIFLDCATAKPRARMALPIRRSDMNKNRFPTLRQQL